MKIIRVCFYFAVFAVFMGTAIFAMWTDRSYMDIHASVKGRVERLFSELPIDGFLNQTHYDYLRATNRNHFNGVTFLTDNRLMMDTLENNSYRLERADGIAELRDYANNEGIPFFFVRVPSKIQDNSPLPFAYSDNTIITKADELYETIAGHGVNTFDLRAEMEKDRIDFAEAFFDMDLHWTAETALWGAGKIGEHMSREFGFELDKSVWEPGNYDRITYRNAFQGNEIRPLGGSFVFEDITAVVPKFYTEIEKTVHDVNEVTAGSFIDVFAPKVRNEVNEFFATEDMEIQERSLTSLVNFNASNDYKVLLIGDSYGLSLVTFFSLGFERTDFLYLITGHTFRVIWDVIRGSDYDIVIFMLSDAVVSLENRPVFEEDRLYLGRP